MQGQRVANITPATLTLAGASGITKTYDGNTSLPSGIAGYGSLTGILASDAVSVAGTPVFASANVARVGNVVSGAVTTQDINQGTVLLAGADAGNYSLSWTNGSGTINPASLTIRANDDAKFVISPDPVFTLSYSGFVNGETTSALDTAATVSRTGTGETAGSYAGGLTVAGGTANNYNITRVAGDFTIVPADQLLVKVAPSSATFGTAAGYNVSSAKYLLSAAGTGTVAATGTTTLTGSGTSFTTQLQVGDVVLAIGNPFGVGQTTTMGIVSGLGRNRLGINIYENFIQTDAAINPGNSGGALVDAVGRLVGINTAIYSETGGSLGIGFAIPASTALAIMDEIIRNGEVTRGWLGLEPQDITPDLIKSFKLKSDAGVIIASVQRHGPAASTTGCGRCWPIGCGYR